VGSNSRREIPKLRRSMLTCATRSPQSQSCGRKDEIPFLHRIALGIVAVALLLLTSCREANTMTLQITSPAFRNGEAIPNTHTADGRDISPALKWAEPPSDTLSFALFCEDPDAPHGTFTHWVLFNIPADARQLGENIPNEKTLSNGARHGA